MSIIIIVISDQRRSLSITTKLQSIEEIIEEVSVTLLAELQQKQTSENKALNKILSSQEVWN